MGNDESTTKQDIFVGLFKAQETCMVTNDFSSVCCTESDVWPYWQLHYPGFLIGSRRFPRLGRTGHVVRATVVTRFYATDKALRCFRSVDRRCGTIYRLTAAN